MNWNNFFNSETITAIVSILLTFITSRRLFNQPQNTEIVEESLLNAYLPLIKIFYQCKHKYLDADKIEFLNNVQNQDKIKEILSNYYVYLSPELPEKIYSLFEDAKYGLFSQDNFNKIYYEINEDYEQIKKYLGYPCMSALQKFFRKDGRGKIHILGTIINKVMTTYTCFLLIFTITLFFLAGNFSLKSIFIALFAIYILIFGLYTIK